MSRLGVWWQWQDCQRQARRWFHYNDALALAARSMFYLNRAARNGGPSTSYVYDLKNAFVEHLYRSGFCVFSAQQEQRAECWECNGTGEDPWAGYGAPCWKCDGTGIYRTYHLYRFIFEIHGRRYVWHQPKSLIEFDIQLSHPDEWGKYKREPGNGESLSRDIASLYYVTLYEYLQQQGIQIQDSANPGAFLKCAQQDWRRWLRQHDWYWLWHRRKSRLIDIIRAVRSFLDTGTWLLEEEIPF